MKQDDYSKFTKDAPSTEGLASLSEMVTDLYLAEIAAAEAAEIAKEAQAKVRDISEHKIPELMIELGLAAFETTNGIKLKIADVYRASIPKPRKDEAFKWLDEHEEGGMIKNNVIIGFARDQAEDADDLIESLEDDGYTVKNEQKVEPATLRAWVRKKLEAGEDIPMDLFGAAQIKQAKITARPESMFGE